MKPDLHTHTHFSDGKHSATYLIERARENSVSHLAISDHDCVDALVDLEPCEDIELIQGVEISCAWDAIELHVVGLCIDPKQPALTNLLTTQQNSRRDRVAQMAEKLERIGTSGLLETLAASKSVALTRSHVADFLVNRKLCKTRQKAFKTHLNKQGKIYASSNWCSLEAGISAIKAAKGIAVLAHPGRYPLNKSKLKRLIAHFKSVGGDALEVSYPNIAPTMKQNLETMAVDQELFVSCGSDFHDAAAQWTAVGKFPPLARAVEARAVWHHPNWRTL